MLTFSSRLPRPAASASLKRGGLRQVPRGDHLLHVLDDQVRQHPLERREHVADLRRDDGPHRRAWQHFLQRVGEVLENDDGGGAGVLELVLEFARGVKRVGVDHHDAGPLRAEQRHGVLDQVGQHDRHAVALLQPGDLLQVGGEVAAQLVELAVRDRHAHVPVGRQIGEPGAARFKDLLDRVEFRRVHVGGDAFRILLQPYLFHRLRSTGCGFHSIYGRGTAPRMALRQGLLRSSAFRAQDGRSLGAGRSELRLEPACAPFGPGGTSTTGYATRARRLSGWIGTAFVAAAGGSLRRITASRRNRQESDGSDGSL